jgi:hypothetical protein
MPLSPKKFDSTPLWADPEFQLNQARSGHPELPTKTTATIGARRSDASTETDDRVPLTRVEMDQGASSPQHEACFQQILQAGHEKLEAQKALLKEALAAREIEMQRQWENARKNWQQRKEKRKLKTPPSQLFNPIPVKPARPNTNISLYPRRRLEIHLPALHPPTLRLIYLLPPPWSRT